MVPNICDKCAHDILGPQTIRMHKKFAHRCVNNSFGQNRDAQVCAEMSIPCTTCQLHSNNTVMVQCCIATLQDCSDTAEVQHPLVSLHLSSNSADTALHCISQNRG